MNKLPASYLNKRGLKIAPPPSRRKMALAKPVKIPAVRDQEERAPDAKKGATTFAPSPDRDATARQMLASGSNMAETARAISAPYGAFKNWLRRQNITPPRRERGPLVLSAEQEATARLMLAEGSSMVESARAVSASFVRFRRWMKSNGVAPADKSPATYAPSPRQAATARRMLAEGSSMVETAGAISAPYPAFSSWTKREGISRARRRLPPEKEATARRMLAEGAGLRAAARAASIPRTSLTKWAKREGVEISPRRKRAEVRPVLSLTQKKRIAATLAVGGGARDAAIYAGGELADVAAWIASCSIAQNWGSARTYRAAEMSSVTPEMEAAARSSPAGASVEQLVAATGMTARQAAIWKSRAIVERRFRPQA